MNHALVDGNKRVAFALTAVLLGMNGYRLAVAADDAERFIIEQLISQHPTLDEIAQWLTEHMQPRRHQP